MATILKIIQIPSVDSLTHVTKRKVTYLIHIWALTQLGFNPGSDKGLYSYNVAKYYASVTKVS